MFRKHVAGLFAVLALTAACATSPRASDDASRTAASLSQPRPNVVTKVIIVRHAEKTGEAGDPGLTAAGMERAQALVDVARNAKVTNIITTQYRRTRETAQPSAMALNLTPQVIPATANHLRETADTVRAHPGSVFLIVGHSNTVPDLVAALGAPAPAAICDNEYDGLYVVTLTSDGRPPSVVQSRYGMESQRGSGCPAMR